MTDKLGILDELDDSIETVIPKFKKKTPKVKSVNVHRLTFRDDDQDEEDNNLIIPSKQSGGFKSRNPFKTVQSSSFRNNKFKTNVKNDSDEILELDDDPENDPVIENIHDLGEDFKLRPHEESISSPSPIIPEKKYVPIETNKFSIKISKQELQNEYRDEHSLDFNEEDEPKGQVYDDSDTEMAQAQFIDDAPLKIKKAEVSEKYQQISDRYDVEIKSDSDYDEDDNNNNEDSPLTSGPKGSIKVKEILPIDEQIDALRQRITDLQIKKTNAETNLNLLTKSLAQTKQEKENLQHKLDAYEL
ncbi:uncharacterized protein RJT21DRAFT_25889 [Scheffersomyces amazonensis]|uniref:uncharacterized protein n=1 Tax=Scheffersomyces amazonensis TaxID=1078765 RepID=UPI00315C7C16